MSNTNLKFNLSWKDALNCSESDSIKDARKIAKKKGYQYFIYGPQVFAVEGAYFSITSIRDLIIYLSVPDEEKAKKRNAKWDAQLSKWYGLAHHIDDLCQWTSEDDRVYIHCPMEHYPYAIERGAIKAKDGKLFLPIIG